MSENPPEPDYEYMAYIDESGETGLKKILAIDASGSSEWFVLSLVIVPKAEIPNIDQWIAEVMVETRTRLPDLHFADLLPSQSSRQSRSVRTRRTCGDIGTSEPSAWECQIGFIAG